ncbi:hypothetical protein GDO86_013374 [Hymenochirus boettgeri]|uniref:Uncharacterized protein n=1 Tax=Hymenochirus boettgeri TaxID=247094 RepID=A0A8T2IR37_9PIPI|nr:hypothetical protein GDO86_013374 [Hymenochirus boettgeri]
MTKCGSELLCDFRDFGRQHVLRDALQTPDSRLYCSPGGDHLFVLLPHKLLSFLRLPTRAPLAPSAYLERSWAAHSPRLTTLLFPLGSAGYGWVLALVWENGRCELWSPPRDGVGKGWEVIQSVDLCTSPRARLVSVCSNEGSLVWCEERPPSEAKAQGPSGTRPYRYCICQRWLVWQGEQRATFGSMRIILHHSPLYHVLSSNTHIFMVPDGSIRTQLLTQLLLVYSPLEDKINMTTTANGLLDSKSLTECDSDFKKLVLECLGHMSAQIPANLTFFTVTGSGELLLLDTEGLVHLLYPDGIVRCVYDFKKQTIPADASIHMQIFGGTLVCALDTVLYLVEVDNGRLIKKTILNVDHVILMTFLEADGIHLMTKAGIYKICLSNIEEIDKIEPALLEMIYEEACKYYQRRSLNSTKLTVLELKKEGIFQAPFMLSSILKNYQKEKVKSKKHTGLINTIASELESYLSLEQLKNSVMSISENATEKCCENLVDKEVARLLQSDLDKDNLIYMNSLFNLFPKAAWKSIKEILQFHQNGDGKLVLRATVDLWKRILGPPSALNHSSPNGVRPLFEIICQSMYTFKPRWLPLFVQQAQNCSGLTWGVSNKENCEGVPLYKRALTVVNKNKDNTTGGTNDWDIEIDILLFSGRPQAIIQAIHMLIGLQQWERVFAETKKFSELSPIITKDIFITLLTEFVMHRHLDSYLNELCEICPESITATEILRTILQNIPNEEHPPISHSFDTYLTIGLLKPLLNKVLQNQGRQDQNSVGLSLSLSPQQSNHFDHPFCNGDGLTPDIYAPDSMFKNITQ